MERKYKFKDQRLEYALIFKEVWWGRLNEGQSIKRWGQRGPPVSWGRTVAEWWGGRGAEPYESFSTVLRCMWGEGREVLEGLPEEQLDPTYILGISQSLGISLAPLRWIVYRSKAEGRKLIKRFLQWSKQEITQVWKSSVMMDSVYILKVRLTGFPFRSDTWSDRVETKGQL